jgi:hypothetical protein
MEPAKNIEQPDNNIIRLSLRADRLFDVVQRIHNAENEFAPELTKEEWDEVNKIFEEDVDAFKICMAAEDSFIAQKEAAIESLQKLIDEHQKQIEYAEKRKGRYSELLLKIMRMGNFEKISGRNWTFWIKKTDVLDITDKDFKDPSESLWKQFPQFIRRKESQVTYSWKKDDLKKAIKAGEIKVHFANLKINEHLNCNSKGR